MLLLWWQLAASIDFSPLTKIAKRKRGGGGGVTPQRNQSGHRPDQGPRKAGGGGSELVVSNKYLRRRTLSGPPSAPALNGGSLPSPTRTDGTTHVLCPRRCGPDPRCPPEAHPRGGGQDSDLSGAPCSTRTRGPGRGTTCRERGGGGGGGRASEGWRGGSRAVAGPRRGGRYRA